MSVSRNSRNQSLRDVLKSSADSLSNEHFNPFSRLSGEYSDPSIVIIEKPKVAHAEGVEKLHKVDIDIPNKELIRSAFDAILEYYARQKIEAGGLNYQTIPWRCTKIEEIDTARVCRVFKVTWLEECAASEKEKHLILKVSAKGMVGGDLQAQSMAQRICESAGIPVPSILCHPRNFKNPDGTECEILAETLVEGVTAASLPPEKWGHVFAQLGHYMGKIHSINIPSLSGNVFYLSNDIPYLSERPPTWRVSRRVSDFYDAIKYLRDNKVLLDVFSDNDLKYAEKVFIQYNNQVSDFSSLVHNDCHLGNIITDNDGNIKAVIDWAASEIDTPLSELSYLIQCSADERFRPKEPNSFHHSVPFNGLWSVVIAEFRGQFLRNYFNRDIPENEYHHLQMSMLCEKLRLLIVHAAYHGFRYEDMQNWTGLCLDAAAKTVNTIKDYSKLIYNEHHSFEV